MDTVPAVAMSGVRFSWPESYGFALFIDDFQVMGGEKLLLIGPSGTGKSTLLSLLCGILVPQQGAVRILDENLTTLSAPRRDRFRAENIGIIFQMFNLLPYGTVLDNVLLQLSFAPNRRVRTNKHGGPRQQALHLLSALGLDGVFTYGMPAASLSVGQQQRVAAARALIGDPEIVLADEPTSALDAGSQETFLDLLFNQVDAVGATLVMVSHDERLATRFDRILRLAEITRVAPVTGDGG